MTDEEAIRKAQRDAASALALAKQTTQRTDDLMSDLPKLITDAVEKAINNQPQVSEEEREFLALAVQAQAQRVRLRQAIIEKTIPSLVWMMVLGVFMFMKHVTEEYMKVKGWVVPWK
jgi:alkylhydroperoxidase/carboxymuconolactone decarboxylase family protein YurZ